MNQNKSNPQQLTQQQRDQQQHEPTALIDVSSIMYGRKRKRAEFACDQCDSVLTTAYSLQIHKRTHTGERPFVCDECGYRSICLSMLKRHVATHNKVRYGFHSCPGLVELLYFVYSRNLYIFC